MKTKTAVGFLFLILTTLTGFSSKPMILEAKDIQNLQVTANREPNGTTIRVSGLAFHSALAVKDFEIKREGKTLVLSLHLVRAQKGLSGSFAYSVPLPDGVERVLIGVNRVEIWPKHSDLERRPR